MLKWTRVWRRVTDDCEKYVLDVADVWKGEVWSERCGDGEFRWKGRYLPPTGTARSMSTGGPTARDQCFRFVEAEICEALTGLASVSYCQTRQVVGSWSTNRVGVMVQEDLTQQLREEDFWNEVAHDPHGIKFGAASTAEQPPVSPSQS